MLPPKIGLGVLGSSSGGVKPTGASLVGASAAVLTVRGGTANLVGLKLGKDKVDGCFHEATTRSPDFGVERVDVKREAWVAMAMRERERLGIVMVYGLSTKREVIVKGDCEILGGLGFEYWIRGYVLDQLEWANLTLSLTHTSPSFSSLAFVYLIVG